MREKQSSTNPLAEMVKNISDQFRCSFKADGIAVCLFTPEMHTIPFVKTVFQAILNSDLDDYDYDRSQDQV